MSKVIKEGKKIVVKKTEKELVKEEREARIKQNKTKQGKISNEDLFQYLNDIVEIIREIKS